MPPQVYEESLYGQVLPIEWDDDEVSGVMLLVDSEEEFIVEPDKNGKQLCVHVDRWVTAEGLVKETAKELRFKIHTFTVEDDDGIEYDW